jgi:hypothetical protein
LEAYDFGSVFPGIETARMGSSITEIALEHEIGIVALGVFLKSDKKQTCLLPIRLPGGNWISKQDLVNEVGMYFIESGELPLSAMDLLPEEFLTVDSFENLDADQSRDLFNRMGFLINPKTLKLYGSFGREHWAPSKMFFAPLKFDEAGRLIRHDGKRVTISVGDTDGDGSNDTVNNPQGFSYGVFGEKPDEILYVDFCIVSEAPAS